jgi:hypothetical protein
MGVYVYGLRSPRNMRRVLVEIKDGFTIEVIAASMSYAYKEYYSFARTERNPYDRFIAPGIRQWESISENARPAFCVMTSDDESHVIKEGQQVLYWPNGSVPDCVADTPRYGNSVTVGRVVKVLGKVDILAPLNSVRLYEIYETSREFAKVHGDPCLGTIYATSKEEAEREYSTCGGRSETGAWAVLYKDKPRF